MRRVLPPCAGRSRALITSDAERAATGDADLPASCARVGTGESGVAGTCAPGVDTTASLALVLPVLAWLGLWRWRWRRPPWRCWNIMVSSVA